MAYMEYSKRSHEEAFDGSTCQDDYPSPPQSDGNDTYIKDEDEQAYLETQPQKKKRRQWGQYVPEIVPVLPPRKRAKTAEEKEQRKNERILRNRRAADKSRQRQKAAQADLENENITLKAKVAHMENLLLQYGIPQSALAPPTPAFSVITQAEHQVDEIDLDTPVPSSALPDTQLPQLSFVETTTSHSPLKFEEVPTLAPQLNVDINNLAVQANSMISSTDTTQYPAAILCDPQCLSDSKISSSTRHTQATTLIFNLLTVLHSLMASLSYLPLSSTHSVISQPFQILERILVKTSPMLESALLNNFNLTHILISMPSTSTQPAVFRLRLLSRLLACNPSLAPLFMMAADRALHERLATGESWTADPDARWAVASLMTIKWSIRWLNKQHKEVRNRVRDGMISEEYRDLKLKAGVEIDAVRTHCGRFDGVDGIEDLYRCDSNATTVVGSPVISARLEGSKPGLTTALAKTLPVR